MITKRRGLVRAAGGLPIPTMAKVTRMDIERIFYLGGMVASFALLTAIVF
jgi:hypothetical protein